MAPHPQSCSCCGFKGGNKKHHTHAQPGLNLDQASAHRHRTACASRPYPVSVKPPDTGTSNALIPPQMLCADIVPASGCLSPAPNQPGCRAGPGASPFPGPGLGATGSRWSLLLRKSLFFPEICPGFFHGWSQGFVPCHLPALLPRVRGSGPSLLAGVTDEAAQLLGICAGQAASSWAPARQQPSGREVALLGAAALGNT